MKVRFSLLAAACAVALGVAGTAGSSTSVSSAIPWSKLSLQKGPPPWPSVFANLTKPRLKLLHLSPLPQEGTVLHIHQHLDLYVNARRVTVPAYLGIDIPARYITEVHTHDTSGVIHVESPKQRDFTLGQLFGEWGVKLTANCVGRYCGHVKWWVNGQRVTGDPSELVLRAHQEIVIAAGPPPLVVPKSYAFPPGE